MIDIEKIEKEFKQFCEQNGLRSRGLDVQKYRIDNHYWKSVDHIWDELTNDEGCKYLDELEVDINMWFKHVYPTVPSELVITEDVYDAVWAAFGGELYPEWFDDAGDFNIALDGLTASDERVPVNVRIDMASWWEVAEFEELCEMQEVRDAIDDGCLEDEFSTVNFIDDIMAYWTIYFQPDCCWDHIDEELAWKCGLAPFTYKGEQYVALGGCGMDLSPKLDAYQARKVGSLPRDSKAFSDKNYFDYVACIKAEEALKLCELDEPVYRFADVKVNEDEHK